MRARGGEPRKVGKGRRVRPAHETNDVLELAACCVADTKGSRAILGRATTTSHDRLSPPDFSLNLNLFEPPLTPFLSLPLDSPKRTLHPSAPLPTPPGRRQTQSRPETQSRSQAQGRSQSRRREEEGAHTRGARLEWHRQRRGRRDGCRGRGPLLPSVNGRRDGS